MSFYLLNISLPFGYHSTKAAKKKSISQGNKSFSKKLYLLLSSFSSLSTQQSQTQFSNVMIHGGIEKTLHNKSWKVLLFLSLVFPRHQPNPSPGCSISHFLTTFLSHEPQMSLGQLKSPRVVQKTLRQNVLFFFNAHAVVPFTSSL